MNEQQRQLIEPINAWQEAMLKHTIQACDINSGSYNREGIADVITYFDQLFADICDQQQRITLPPLQSINNQGDVLEQHTAEAALYHIRPEAPIQILCTGHTDTVFPKESTFQTCWQEGDRLRGPGVADMKGGLVVLYHALKAIHQSPFAEQLGFTILLSPDEEIGSPRSAEHLVHWAKKCDVGMVYEPSLEDGTLAGARKGSGNFDVVVQGKATHAGRDFFGGRNAIVAAANISQKLAALSNKETGITVNIGRIDGGGPVNVVPDNAVIRFNVRIEQPEQQQPILEAIQAVIQNTAGEHDVTAELHGRFGRPPKPMDAKHQALFEQLKHCGELMGIPIGWRSTGGCCEGNNLAAAGLPTIDTLGVRGGAIHSEDEFMCIDSFVERAQLSALLMSRMPDFLNPKP